VQLSILLSRARPEMAHLMADVARWVEEQGLQADSASADAASPVDSSPIDFSSPTGYHRETEYADLARALIALDRAGEALPLLDRLLSAARSMERWGDAIRYLVQQTLAFHALQDTPSALVCLGQALTLAEPEGYVRLFVDEGEPMAELLQAVRREQTAGSLGLLQNPLISGTCHPERSAAESKGLLAHQSDSSTPLRSAQNDNYAPVLAVSPAYVDKLLTAFGTAGQDEATAALSTVRRPSSPTRNRPGSAWGVESLSVRELEVLRLMAAGHKYAQIAEQLVISLNTVRHHTRNIFGKLDVHSRAQAIVRARELDLL
jgi:LuxR family maltose regulon positive regulatory protein